MDQAHPFRPMRSPTLSDLPPPPTGKTGWPWTVETPPLPPARPDGSPWPRISIVTPSYNQGEFVEETIRSVLLQGYPDLEYIIIDGGSIDQSVEIIRKYERWASYWVSEKDRGQSHAINKGFDRTTGILLSWLNSDDVLLPGALQAVSLASRYFDQKMIVAGLSEFRDASGSRSLWVVDRLPRTASDIFCFFSTYLPQPSVFLTRRAFEECGGLAEHLYYTMDLDLWLRIAEKSRIELIDRHLSWMRQHDQAKTVQGGFRRLAEVEQVLHAHAEKFPRDIVRKTFAAARIERSRLWVSAGLTSFQKDNKNYARLCAYQAMRTHFCTVFTRFWLGLALRVTLPRFIRAAIFQGNI